MPVHITLLEESESSSLPERGRVMAEALEALATADIEDPLVWQREMRRDRSLLVHEP